MRVTYYPETDSLYIDLSEARSVESREVSEGVVLDYDQAGNLVGIDIDNASTKVQKALALLATQSLPRRGGERGQREAERFRVVPDLSTRRDRGEIGGYDPGATDLGSALRTGDDVSTIGRVL